MALALYRKYRPAKFAEVVGQEHVTEPLGTALAAGRINHAYLFSGPRGCGKTSSARILARSLNCVEGPTPDPCGVCNSCVALAPEGPGNIDVVELDAASHGGVDDARELRDRAFYAPAESRYRVFIVDEAHMVTTQGFNALLKIVEEPPEHLVFVFATTEPDKVLPTIRSRTHHYPFRLIPPGTLRSLLERICADEGVQVQSAVYPLVIRAGGGSARDTLSVMDQLLAGAGPEGVTYERAMALLGVTDVALIDDVVDALAAGDGAAVYQAVDRLVEAGHDPRRFAQDLLQRLRDLMLVQAVPEAGSQGLVEAASDELERMVEQAARLGPATLARYGEIVHAGLTEMRGATAPRLLLELLCARMLLPAATTSDAGLLERLERVERRNAISAEPLAAGASGAAEPAKPQFVRPSQRQDEPAPSDRAAEPAEAPSGRVAEPAGAPASRVAERPEAPSGRVAEPAGAPSGRVAEPAPSGRVAEPAGQPAGPAAEPAEQPAGQATEPAAGPSSPVADRAAPPADAPQRPGTEPATERRAAEPQAADVATPSDTVDPAQPRSTTDGSESAAGRAAQADASGAAGAPGSAEQPPAAEESGQTARGQRPDPVREPEHAAERPSREPQRAFAAEPESPAVDAAPEPAAAPEQPAAEEQEPVAAGLDASAVRRVWSEILAAARERSRSTEALMVNSTVRAVEGDTLVLAIGSPPLARRLQDTRNTDVISAALHAVLGVQWRVRVEAGEGGGAGPARQAAPRQAPQRPAPQRPSRREDPAPAERPEPEAPRPAPQRGEYQRPQRAEQPRPPADDRGPGRPESGGFRRPSGGRGRGDEGVPLPPEPPDEEPPPDDEEAMIAEADASRAERSVRRDPEEVAIELLSSQLGAKALDQR
ncbi:DNA polymerase III subunit gamma and tau [Pseudonocardia oroxyli]|uniref:DNA polymerase III subunit gamma and tau n=1 Tax=Pseudonocardia oroxyli TaxID=366584 RepID=UPI000B87AC4C|nr:DNA polymerase III subunit gamma and tau [Pseudonocardia oroxyli]